MMVSAADKFWKHSNTERWIQPALLSCTCCYLKNTARGNQTITSILPMSRADLRSWGLSSESSLCISNTLPQWDPHLPPFPPPRFPFPLSLYPPQHDDTIRNEGVRGKSRSMVLFICCRWWPEDTANGAGQPYWKRSPHWFASSVRGRSNFTAVLPPCWRFIFK